MTLFNCGVDLQNLKICLFASTIFFFVKAVNDMVCNITLKFLDDYT
jgi:hypothetical protein